jgi:hypothetical protein
MAYTISDPQSGFLPITGIDTGIVPPNNFNSGSTATVPSPPLAPGQIVKAIDPTYGGGEFILLLGAASTIVGSLVRYNTVSFATTLVVNTAVQNTPVAVSMSANTTTTSWSWYQIAGTAVLAKTAVIILPNVAVYISATAGKVKALASAGLQVCECKSQLATTASASGTVLVTINRPGLQSQVS